VISSPLRLKLIPPRNPEDAARREIFEAELPNLGGRMQRFNLFKGQVAGVHFHRRNEEVFLITEGHADVVLCRVDTDGNAVEEPTVFTVGPDDVVEVPTMTTHVFRAIDRVMRMVCRASQGFEADDMPRTDWLLKHLPGAA